jgi:hypothetical protein
VRAGFASPDISTGPRRHRIKCLLPGRLPPHTILTLHGIGTAFFTSRIRQRHDAGGVAHSARPAMAGIGDPGR